MILENLIGPSLCIPRRPGAVGPALKAVSGAYSRTYATLHACTPFGIPPPVVSKAPGGFPLLYLKVVDVLVIPISIIFPGLPHKVGYLAHSSS